MPRRTGVWGEGIDARWVTDIGTAGNDVKRSGRAPGQVGSAYARHEAYRVGYEARRAARATRIANLKSGVAGASTHRPPPQSARTVFGLLGGLFILLGVMALLLPGFGAASPFVACLAPGVAPLIPWLLWSGIAPGCRLLRRRGYPSSRRDTGRAIRTGERGQASGCSECVNSTVTARRAAAAPGEHIRSGSIVLSRAGGRVSASSAKRHPQPATRPACRRDVVGRQSLQQWEERVGGARRPPDDV